MLKVSGKLVSELQQSKSMEVMNVIATRLPRVSGRVVSDLQPPHFTKVIA